MTDDFKPDPDADAAEPLDEGGTWLLDLVSAVDHLRRGYRPSFTVWDAISEAIEWADAGQDNNRSPATRRARAAASASEEHEAFQCAVRTWVTVMAERYNAGYQWPHPSARRTFPPTRALTANEVARATG